MSVHPPTLSGDPTLALPEFDAPPADPFDLLAEWVDLAGRRAVREPLAVTLATTDPDGHVSSRVLLVKEISRDGLLFGSHRRSRKGRDLAAVPRGAITFYWRETLQQINLAGPVVATTDEESDRLFHARLPAAQATTAASEQSRPLTDERSLRERAERLGRSDEPIPRPADWGGYRLLPEEIEFWHGSPDRLHRRLRYDLIDGTWSSTRLQP